MVLVPGRLGPAVGRRSGLGSIGVAGGGRTPSAPTKCIPFLGDPVGKWGSWQRAELWRAPEVPVQWRKVPGGSGVLVKKAVGCRTAHAVGLLAAGSLLLVCVL